MGIWIPYRKDILNLINLVLTKTLLSSIYPFPAMHSLLVTINQLLTICQSVHITFLVLFKFLDCIFLPNGSIFEWHPALKIFGKKNSTPVLALDLQLKYLNVKKSWFWISGIQITIVFIFPFKQNRESYCWEFRDLWFALYINLNSHAIVQKT